MNFTNINTRTHARYRAEIIRMIVRDVSPLTEFSVSARSFSVDDYEALSEL